MPGRLSTAWATEPVAELQCDLSDHFDKQVRVVLENAGHIDPEKIDDYISRDGYKALLTALTDMTPDGVIHQITESGLRGRGGGGYPTGLKWGTVAKASGDLKYVICNGDEGDPGAFMDRSVMEGDPHRVIEGMAIAAYAVGASKGFIYVRAEYPLAVARLTTALREARRRGLLGNNIGNTTFNFDIEIRLGAGALSAAKKLRCIASIEGKRGTPKPRPPYPAVSGLWGKPTLINNVETYRQRRAHHSQRRQVVRKHGLGAQQGHQGLRAHRQNHQHRPGRSSHGHQAPRDHRRHRRRRSRTDTIQGRADRRSFRRLHSRRHAGLGVSYDALMAAGSIMGSGGMIVMDDTSCMVNVARFFVEFCMTESCGKCIPCRAGTAQMFTLLTRICEGTGNHGRSGTAGRSLRHRQGDQPLRTRADGAQPGAEHAASTSRTSTSNTSCTSAARPASATLLERRR